MIANDGKSWKRVLGEAEGGSLWAIVLLLVVVVVVVVVVMLVIE
jgi:hypothetical protein